MASTANSSSSYPSKNEQMEAKRDNVKLLLASMVYVKKETNVY